MKIVEIGSSTGSAARPKLPPTAPEVATSALCSRLDAALGSFCIVRSEAISANEATAICAAYSRPARWR